MSKPLSEIFDLVNPPGTREALGRQRTSLLERLADLKAAYLIEQGNTTATAEQLTAILADVERQARMVHEAIEHIDAKLQAADEPLTVQPNRAARRNGAKA